VLTSLYSQRALIWAFANRDFATRYRSSVLGWAWSLIQPLATLIVFAAVFSIVFRIQAGVWFFMDLPCQGLGFSFKFDVFG